MRIFIMKKAKTRKKNVKRIAVFGGTKLGKTTYISFLTEHYDLLLKIIDSNQEGALKGGRTKVTTEYRITIRDEITSEGIYLAEINLTPAFSRISTEKGYMDLLEKHPYLKNTFGFSDWEAVQTTEVQAKKTKMAIYAEERFGQFCNIPFTDDNYEILQTMLTTQGMDLLLRKVILEVAPNAQLREYFQKKNMTLEIVDTKGVLDLDLEMKDAKKEEQEKKDEQDKDKEKDKDKEEPEAVKKIKSASLESLGLDQLDLILFFVNHEDPPNMISIYKETFRSILGGLDVAFIYSKDSNLVDQYETYFKEEVTGRTPHEFAGELLKNIQNPDCPAKWHEKSTKRFRNFMGVLNEMGFATYDSEKKDYSVVDARLDPFSTRFYLPALDCDPDENILDEGVMDRWENQLYLAMASETVKGLIEISLDFEAQEETYHEEIQKVAEFLFDPEFEYAPFSDSAAPDFDHHFHKEIYDKLEVDKKGYNKRGVRDILRIRFEDFSLEHVNKDLQDENYKVLGVKGGVMPKLNGKIAQATTAVVGGGIYYYVLALIEKLATIPDENWEKFFHEENQEVNQEANKKRKNAILQVLHQQLKNHFLDNNAKIYPYFFWDRKKLQSDIQWKHPDTTLETAMESLSEAFLNSFEDPEEE